MDYLIKMSILYMIINNVIIEKLIMKNGQKLLVGKIPHKELRKLKDEYIKNKKIWNLL